MHSLSINLQGDEEQEALYDFSHKYLEKATEQHKGVIETAWQHHLHSGGSRLRAKISLCLGKKADINPATNYPLAATVEVLHQASLLLDDLQEGDLYRRGKTSVWNEFGEATAINLALALIAKSYLYINEIEDTYHPLTMLLQKHISETISKTVAGQQEDLQGVERNISYPEYEQVAREKSGPLFALPFKLIMTLLNENTYHMKKCDDIASIFGVAYQLADDLNDRKQKKSSLNGIGVLLKNNYSEAVAKERALEVVRQTILDGKELFNDLPAYTKPAFLIFQSHLTHLVERKKHV